MRSRAVLLASLLGALLALSLASCSGGSSPEDDWTFIGTWVNSAYNGFGGGPPGKIIATSSAMAIYDRDTDLASAPVDSGTFALADDWSSGGYHYFKGIAVFTLGGTNFFLIRIGNNGNTMETNASTTSYPPAISPAGSQYGIFARQ